jgi:hypothetical protein
MSTHYVVVVTNNLVTAIERSLDASPAPIPATPLEVSSQLAANHRAHGYIDGRYYFEDPQRARIFATLCLAFVKGLAEKRLEWIDALPAGKAEYREHDEHERDRHPPGAG